MPFRFSGIIPEYAINYSLDGSIIRKNSLPGWLSEETDGAGAAVRSKKAWEEEEKKMLESMLLSKGKSLDAKKEIAARLNISLATLYRKLKKYHIS